MRKIIQTILILVILTNCNSNKPKVENYESETLKIERINEKIFKHISYLETNDYGKVACNGMIYLNDNEAIIFDTPTNNNASTELINWFEEKI